MEPREVTTGTKAPNKKTEVAHAPEEEELTADARAPEEQTELARAPGQPKAVVRPPDGPTDEPIELAGDQEESEVGSELGDTTQVNLEEATSQLTPCTIPKTQRRIAA